MGIETYLWFMVVMYTVQFISGCYRALFGKVVWDKILYLEDKHIRTGGFWTAVLSLVLLIWVLTLL